MKRFLVSAASFFVMLGLVFVNPISAQAEVTLLGLQEQISDLYSQINALRLEVAQLRAAQKPVVLGASTVSCTLIYSTLYRGMTESATITPQVVLLQNFLRSRPEVGASETALTSGTFDLATEIAVRRFQAANSIVSSGTASTTGYGKVGKLTQEKIYDLSGCTMYGDVNYDGKISLADFTLLNRAVVDGTANSNPDRVSFDLNSDNTLDAYDANILRDMVSRNIYRHEVPLKYGDMDANRAISLADAVLLTNYSKSSTSIPDKRTRVAADMNKDNLVNETDVSLLRRLIMSQTQDATVPIPAPTPTGVLSVSLSALNPANDIVVAGGQEVRNAVFQFSAQTSAFTIESLKIRATASNLAVVPDLTIKYKDASGTMRSHTAPLVAVTNELPVATFSGMSMFVNKDESANLEVFIKPVATFSEASPSSSSIVLDFDSGFRAVSATGLVQTTTGGTFDLMSNQTTSKGSMFIKKSEPVITPLANSGSPASSKALYKFNVTANAGGDIEIKKFTFSVFMSGVNVGSFYLRNENTGVNVASNLSVDSSGRVVAFVGGSAANNDVVTIGAGQTSTFGLYGSVSGWSTGDTLTVGLAEDIAQTPSASVSTVSSFGNNFIWSDRWILPHSLASSDWTNGYLVEEMPGTGIWY